LKKKNDAKSIRLIFENFFRKNNLFSIIQNQKDLQQYINSITKEDFEEIKNNKKEKKENVK
jgi:hypothetical protein